MKPAVQIDGIEARGGSYTHPRVIVVKLSKARVEIFDPCEGESHEFGRRSLLSALQAATALPPREELTPAELVTLVGEVEGSRRPHIFRAATDEIGIGRGSTGQKVKTAYVYEHTCGADYAISEKAMKDLIQILEEWG